jgi:hypothetical protein
VPASCEEEVVKNVVPFSSSFSSYPSCSPFSYSSTSSTSPSSSFAYSFLKIFYERPELLYFY